MSTYPFTTALVTLLTIALVAPSMLFMVPNKAYAQAAPGVPIIGVGPNEFTTAIKTTWTAIKDTLIEINTFTSAAANYADYINKYYLQPLAFILSGQLMKALTSSVIQYVIGKANGTGVPQFVVDVQKSLRSISDFQKTAYLSQVNLTNSPFATSIQRALGIDYNQSTSLSGFWAKNLCTLGQNIPTYNQSFLTGNWSRGGVTAWFQLTTQSQNNPYTLYQNTQAQLTSMNSSGITGGPSARVQQLSWGQGFMSWCGATEQTGTTGNNPSAYTANTVTTGNNPSAFTANAQGVNPGDPCTDKDGHPGTTQTPGSVIKATLDKVLGGQQDKLVEMGNISTQVNSILGNIGSVLNTINLAANILGGSGANSGGLLGAGAPSSSSSSGGALARFDATSLSTSGNFTSGYGTSGAQIGQDTSSSAVTSAHNTSTTTAVGGIPGYTAGGTTSTASDMPARVQQYQAAWDAIASVANTTKSALQSSMAVCHTYWNNTSSYENSMQNAISLEVVPVLTQAAGISTITDAALAQYQLVQNEPTTSSTYAADLQKLNTMKPTASDVAAAKYDATACGAASASPAGSLTVSGSSIVDQMNLIRDNAAQIQAIYCTAQQTGGGA